MATVDKPSAPDIGYFELWHQFKDDVFGKEVQDATTYSYTWLADQAGHVFLGLLVNLVLTAILKLVGVSDNADLWGMFGAIGITAGYELLAYRHTAARATGLFPLGQTLLRNNALTAAYYLGLGGVLGYLAVTGAVLLVGHSMPWTQLVGMLVLVAAGFVLVPFWFRQKIIWQKAGLPYLFRLAEVAPNTFSTSDARELQALIVHKAPPQGIARQVVIGGPIGSGRTALAAGIGTEFAFNRVKVRYLSFDSLLEFAVGPTRDDQGPRNIEYWPWDDAQVVIIDNVGPLIAAERGGESALRQQFRVQLAGDLQSVASVFQKCHSIWVVGDLSDPSVTSMTGGNLDALSQTIKGYCGASESPLIIELSNAIPEDAPPDAPGRRIMRKATVRKLPPEAGDPAKP